MVAFRACLSTGGQQQLHVVLMARCSKFASRIAELEELTEADREEVRIMREMKMFGMICQFSDI